MVAVASLLVVIALSLLVVRVGAVALELTGLSEDVARFQALSAFSGAGFTTTETESVVTHPARRGVVAVLIRLGSVGIVTAISSLLLSFVGAGEATPDRLGVLVLGVVALLALARSRWFNRLLTPLIERTLQRYTTLDLRDYADLLSLGEDYRIVEIDVDEDSWLADQRLDELSLTDEGVLVLGVIRGDGSYLGAPQPDTRLEVGDTIVSYGRGGRLEELSERRPGDAEAHRRAVAAHARDVAEQED